MVNAARKKINPIGRIRIVNPAVVDPLEPMVMKRPGRYSELLSIPGNKFKRKRVF